MADLSTITTEKLKEDLRFSTNDLDFCRWAKKILDEGGYEGFEQLHEDLTERIEGNQQIIEVIQAELERRNCSYEENRPIHIHAQ